MKNERTTWMRAGQLLLGCGVLLFGGALGADGCGGSQIDIPTEGDQTLSESECGVSACVEGTVCQRSGGVASCAPPQDHQACREDHARGGVESFCGRRDFEAILKICGRLLRAEPCGPKERCVESAEGARCVTEPPIEACPDGGARTLSCYGEGSNSGILVRCDGLQWTRSCLRNEICSERGGEARCVAPDEASSCDEPERSCATEGDRAGVKIACGAESSFEPCAPEEECVASSGGAVCAEREPVAGTDPPLEFVLSWSPATIDLDFAARLPSGEVIRRPSAGDDKSDRSSDGGRLTMAPSNPPEVIEASRCPQGAPCLKERIRWEAGAAPARGAYSLRAKNALGGEATAHIEAWVNGERVFESVLPIGSGRNDQSEIIEVSY